MPVQTGVVWVTPPSKLVKAFEQYGDKVFVAVKAVAAFVAQKMQDEARKNAPWTDRTGNARGGLFGVSNEAAKHIVEIYLAHTMDYGKYLELSNGGKYAIIMPTIQKNLPVIKKMLDDIFK
jgi:hypothetical protein